MAEKNQIVGVESESSAREDDLQNNEDAIDKKAGDDNSPKTAAKNQNDAKGGRSKKRGKWILFLIISLLIIAMAAGAYKFEPKWFKISKIDISSINSLNIKEDNLSEKELPPFFIPPSQGADSSMIRIDLSVIWDGLAAVRFQNKELQIRDDTYKYILKLTEKTEDLNTEVSYIEAEMSRIFREALGVRNLVIMIKEIKYFH